MKAEIPHATELEQQLIGALMLHVVTVEDINLDVEAFLDPSYREIYKAILKCSSNGGCDLPSVTQFMTEKGTIDKVGGIIGLTHLCDNVSTHYDVLHHCKIVQQKYIERQTDKILTDAKNKIATGDIADVIDDLKTNLAALIPDQHLSFEVLSAKLRIDPLADISEPPVCCYIGGKPSMTFGNFSMVDGKKKAGKTFAVGGIVAAVISGSEIIGNIRGNLDHKKNIVLYFDTEQSQFHANRSIKRICKLAGNPNPSNLIAFGLRSLSPSERLAFIESHIQTTPNLSMVIIDGVRDLLSQGINDEPEATSLTSKFLKWTEEYYMHLILLLHQNKNDLNPRGHIGTEIQNKCETLLTVTKDKNLNVFTVACEDSRDIGFNEFAFTVDEDGMIQSSDTPKKEKEKTTKPQFVDDQKQFEVLDTIFKNKLELNYTSLQDAIIVAFGNTFGRNTCRTFITHYMNKEWIKNYRKGMNTFYIYNRATF
jgi:hypothetical protein